MPSHVPILNGQGLGLVCICPQRDAWGSCLLSERVKLVKKADKWIILLGRYLECHLYNVKLLKPPGHPLSGFKSRTRTKHWDTSTTACCRAAGRPGGPPNGTAEFKGRPGDTAWACA